MTVCTRNWAFVGNGPEHLGDTQIAWDRSRLSNRELCEKSVFLALAGPVAESIHRRERMPP